MRLFITVLLLCFLIIGVADAAGASFNPTNITNYTCYGSTRAITFTDTSTVSSPLSYTWNYTGYGSNTSSAQFSTSKNSTASFTVGNFSVRHSVTNATETFGTADKLHWVNVSQYNQLGTDMLPYFPINHIINANVTQLPVHDNNAALITAVRTHLNSVSGNIYLYGYKGYRYNHVGAGVETATPLWDRYGYASDNGSYDQCEDWKIEEGSSDTSSITINRDTNYIFDTAYNNDGNHPMGYYPNGSRVAGIGRIWNRTNLSMTWPVGTTSATACGMPALAGAVTDADIASGSINHALAITLGGTKNSYVWPATHASGVNSSFPGMGERFRLKSTFNTSSYSGVCKMELDAMKKYGAIVTDNYNNNDSQNWNYIGIKVENKTGGNTTGGTMCSGVYFNSANFEFVNQTPLKISATSYEIPVSLPVANFTKDKFIIMRPGVLTVNGSCTNNSYGYQWNFGDGTANTSTINSTHTYTRPGIFTVAFTCENSYGVNAKREDIISIIAWGGGL